MMTLPQIAQKLELSESSLYQAKSRNKKSFPDPCAQFGQVKVYDFDTVEKWYQDHNKRGPKIKNC